MKISGWVFIIRLPHLLSLLRKSRPIKVNYCLVTKEGRKEEV